MKRTAVASGDGGRACEPFCKNAAGPVVARGRLGFAKRSQLVPAQWRVNQLEQRRLRVSKEVVSRLGLEPRTHGLKGRCSTN